MITVALDASTYAGSVAVLDGSRLVAERDVTMKGGDPQQERLMPAVAAALAQAHVTSRDVRRIVCGSGPGSFTSLRIAASIAKGLAFGLGCPLCAVPSLALIVAAASPRAGSYLAALDALRGEMYVGLYAVTPDGEVDETEAPRLAPSGSIETLATRMAASVVGAGYGGHAPRARGVSHLEGMLRARGPVEITTWEPTYGRLAEAQVRWESAHGRPLPAT